jgi:uncharacterized protein (TIGR02246 family)
MSRKTVLLGAMLLTAVACAPAAAPDTAADEARLREEAPVWFDHYNRGDADAVANLYAEDAVLMAPGVPPITGRAAIRNYLVDDIAGSRQAGIRINSGEVTGVGVSGDVAWMTGTFTVTDTAGATIDTGKYLSLYGRTDSGWALIRDIWNSDAEPAVPAPATAPAPAAPAGPPGT